MGQPLDRRAIADIDRKGCRVATSLCCRCDDSFGFIRQADPHTRSGKPLRRRKPDAARCARYDRHTPRSDRVHPRSFRFATQWPPVQRRYGQPVSHEGGMKPRTATNAGAVGSRPHGYGQGRGREVRGDAGQGSPGLLGFAEQPNSLPGSAHGAPRRRNHRGSAMTVFGQDHTAVAAPEYQATDFGYYQIPMTTATVGLKAGRRARMAALGSGRSSRPAFHLQRKPFSTTKLM
jgi:hypothetical protein